MAAGLSLALISSITSSGAGLVDGAAGEPARVQPSRMTQETREIEGLA
jgi:hypothetical protein